MKWFVVCVILLSMTSTFPVLAEALSPEAINEATPGRGGKSDRPVTVKVQILLDRQAYSPGVIDGHLGDATEIALKAYQTDNELEPTGKVDEETFGKLTEHQPEPVIVPYAIAREDIKGPFTRRIPDDIEAKAKLDRLGYTGPRELIAERFHMDEDLLKALNPDADFGVAGTEIAVASVEAPLQEGRAAADDAKVAKLVIDKGDRTLRAFDGDGRLVALYPATIGSERNPAPTGELKVVRVAHDPTWNYDPELELEGKKHRPDEKMTVKPGPNNPVGTIWIDLDKEHYGIHGTPEPEKIGKNFSSGCVRLTNWDAEELAGLVRTGTPVVFED